MSDIELVSATKSFGGWLKRYKHRSQVLNCEMIFAIYLPPAAEANDVPLLWWLSGLTCTDENFMQKAGAHKTAAELGLAIVCPDTSPRGTDLPGEHESYDFGSGAGFYVNATQSPWSQHYRMYDYVLNELPTLIESVFPVTDRRSIAGHSMGGHGALILALRNPERYRSVSAFSPISNPVNCPWGKKAFTAYLGKDASFWAEYDASVLMREARQFVPALVDQGDADNFLAEQLHPEALEAAADTSSYPLQLNFREGYDHSYYFISSFIEFHLRFHGHYLSV